MLFSIITVCFNSEQTIERTMRSILTQDFTDYEYIIVDGNSTDGTLDIVKRLEPLFKGRLKWHSEPDSGIYDAFNKGIRRSAGNYLWIVNSDDLLEPDALAFAADLISRQDREHLPVISGAMRFFDEQTNKTIYIAKSNEESCRAKYRKNLMGLTHPATLVPMYIYEQTGLFDTAYQSIGDYEWFHRMYGMGLPVVFTDRILTNMSNKGNSNQLTWKHFMHNYGERKHFFTKYYPDRLDRDARLARWCMTFLYYMFCNRKKKLIKWTRSLLTRRNCS